MEEEMAKVAEENSKEEEEVVVEKLESNTTGSPGFTWFSGPCKRCDKKISMEVGKDGKVKCAACGAVF